MCRVAKVETAAQKKSLHATERESERVQQRRVEYEAEVNTELFSKLKFLDEAGSNLGDDQNLRAGGERRTSD